MIKRILAVLLALILILAFVSCESESEKTYETERLEALCIYMTEATEAWYHGYEEYNRSQSKIRFFHNRKLIPYIKIAFLGSFNSFFCSSKYCALELGMDTGNDDMEREIDRLGLKRAFFDIELFYASTEHEVLPPKEESYYGITPIDISVVDRSTGMRKLLEGYYGGFVDVDGVRYIYTHGTLQGIKWVHSGYEFILYVPEAYPLQLTELFAAKMMDPALAPAARDAFNRAFDACMEVNG